MKYKVKEVELIRKYLRLLRDVVRDQDELHAYDIVVWVEEDFGLTTTGKHRSKKKLMMVSLLEFEDRHIRQAKLAWTRLKLRLQTPSHRGHNRTNSTEVTFAYEWGKDIVEFTHYFEREVKDIKISKDELLRAFEEGKIVIKPRQSVTVTILLEDPQINFSDYPSPPQED